jgi:ribonuclease D
VLIDPITCPDLALVQEALAGTEAVLHAAAQDLPCLLEVGYQPDALFDTELAGRLLGYPRVGLATLAESVLGVTLEKSHSAADWSRRPLPAEWLRYAALDVEILIELRDALAAQLEAAGKGEWARQEFAAVLAAKPPAPRLEPWRRTSGIHRVKTRRGLAVVRELWLEREALASELDVSPRRLLADTAIVEAARLPPGRASDTSPIAGFRNRTARRYRGNWSAALARARAQAEEDLPSTGAPQGSGPPPAHRWAERDPRAAERLVAARAVVAALADEHSLPAENLLPPDALRRLAWEPPERADRDRVRSALLGYGARPWQVDLTATPLAKALSRVNGKSGSRPAAGHHGPQPPS